MKTIRIFVEGKSDKKFLPTFLKHILNTEILPDYIDIIPVNGITNLQLVDIKFQENTAIGGLNLGIFDTDNLEKDFGSIEARMEYLQNKKKELGIEFDYFLLPNNQNDGDLESILENIAAVEHQEMMQCFDKYEDCVKRFLTENGKYRYNIPAKKSKIYTYVESLPKNDSDEKKFKKDKDFFFDNKAFWNLDADCLNPLKDFLLPYFS